MEFSLNDYANRNPLNAIIAKNMVNMDALGDGPGLFEEKACFCFSVAYQICRRLIDESPAQIWILPDLYKKSLYHSGDKDLKSIMQAVTLSIVLIMTEHLPDEWKTKNHELCDEILKKIKNIFVKGETTSLYGGLTMNMRATFGFDTEAVSAYKALRQGTDIDYVLTYEEFNPQGVNIQNSATGNVLMAAMEKRIAESEIKIGSLIPRFEYDQPNEGLKIVQGGNKEIVDFSEKEKEYKKQIDDLKSEVESLRAENGRLKNSNPELKWIGCFDGFLHPNLNAEAIAEKLKGMSSPHLPKNERGYWWVFYTVLTEINWIPKTNHKLLLQWANLHFDCGWDWSKDNQFKFSDINSKIKTAPSPKWNKDTTGNVIGDYYGELAKSMRDAFVESIEGKLLDRGEFIKPGCKRINNGRK